MSSYFSLYMKSLSRISCFIDLRNSFDIQLHCFCDTIEQSYSADCLFKYWWQLFVGVCVLTTLWEQVRWTDLLGEQNSSRQFMTCSLWLSTLVSNRTFQLEWVIASRNTRQQPATVFIQTSDKLQWNNKFTAQVT